MSIIFINGLKSKAGGGKSILNNYLMLLKKSDSKNKFFVLVPKQIEYLNYYFDFIEVLDIADLYKKNILFPFVNHFLLPKLIKDLNIDVVFNMGDIVIPTKIPQVYLFDWSYAVYPESSAWKTMDRKGYFERKIKLFFFKKYINYATLVIAQTKTMKQKLEIIYGLKNVEIVPNAVSLDNLSGGEYFDFNLPKEKFKCLYLTYYYSHKNLEIFIPLAKKIRETGWPFCLIVTIAPSQHKKAKQFLETIQKEGLESTIINVGPVPMSRVPSLYTQTDSLLMPTLLESFSGTYIEAMHHGKPIMTSNLDFAIDVCGDAAFYFDPLDAESILNTIKDTFQNKNLRLQKIEYGKTKLEQMLNWQQTFDKYQGLLEDVARKR
jgi:glycosyltransferase involved in cell wall biosynthesis